MVQYYRDLWVRCREMLTPLPNLDGECGHTKATKANSTKWKPWHQDSVHQTAFDNVKAIMLSWPILTTRRSLRYILTALSFNLVQLLPKTIGRWLSSARN